MRALCVVVPDSAVRRQVMDVQILLGADSAYRIAPAALAAAGEVTLETHYCVIAFGIDLTGSARLQNRMEATARHVHGKGLAGGLQEGRSEVRKADKIV